MTVTITTPMPVKKKVRVVSGIAYPYFDHAASIKVAEVIQNVAGGSCAPDFLAAKLHYASVRSGTFLTRVAAARMFGYITTSARNFVVTERGRAILAPVMPEDGVNAGAEGFLAVPLFKRVFDDFSGRSIPPEVGLKNLFINTYRIVPDRAQQAVRVFMNSAEQCGFFHAGRTRLIRPIANTAQTIQASVETQQTGGEANAKREPAPALQEKRGHGGAGGGDGGGIHTAFVGLLRELPGPGDSWTESEQQAFITAFTGLVKFIFPAKKGEAGNG